MELYDKVKKKIVKTIGTDKMEFDSKFADIAIPCFGVNNPMERAQEAAKALSEVKMFSKVEAQGPYVNIFLDWNSVGKDLLPLKKGYGGGFLKGPAIVEHTSVNPNASPHVGRARNPIIGDSLVRLLKFAGMKVSTHYYVNDMGKQIALLVWAGQERKKLDFHGLLDLYVKANEKMEGNGEIESEVFNLLKKFEDGDSKVSKNFRSIVSVAVEGQKEIFSKINVDFDEFDYESDFLDSIEMRTMMKKLKESGKLFEDKEGRIVLDTTDIAKDSYFVLTRSNGTSLYGARDLAYTLHKSKLAKGNLNVIVLGEDQKLYFKQIAYAMELAGYQPPKVVHYSFVLLPEGKMSTRKGNVVLLEDLFKEVYRKAYDEVSQRYPSLPEKGKKERAEKIAIAAIRYGIVKVSPEKTVLFDINAAIKFEGDTGPYLQYTYARARSILRKSKKRKGAMQFGTEEKELIRLISRFPLVVKKAYDEMKPHHIAEYTHNLCDSFNSYYQSVKVIGSQNEFSRLKIVEAASVVIGECLGILGIDKMEEM